MMIHEIKTVKDVMLFLREFERNRATLLNEILVMPMIARDAVKVFNALTNKSDELVEKILKEVVFMIDTDEIEGLLKSAEILFEKASKYKKLENLFRFIKIEADIDEADIFVDQLRDSFGDNRWVLKVPSRDIDIILESDREFSELMSIGSAANCVIYYGEGVTQAQETMAQLLCKG